MSIREEQRDRFAQEVGKFTYERLLQFGITRIASIGGLDRIGLPVYTSCRPAGRSISISSGKGITNDQARAGAILEAIELWAAENPNPPTDAGLAFASLDQLTDRMPWEMAQFCPDAPMRPDTPISWDSAHNINADDSIYVPSDMIWMAQRVKTPFMYFQTTSNGLASGISRQDAELSALYEVVERDAWSISENLVEHAGQWPERVCLENLPYPLDEIVAKMFGAGLYPFLFDITNDLHVPSMKCLLVDPTESSAGMFAGHGCDLHSITAAKRALLEASQARCCYIAGARDDLFRRHFLLLKSTDQKKIIEQLSAIPETVETLADFPPYETIEQEWNALVKRLAMFGISEIYSKVLYENIPDPVIVRIVAPQLENPRFEHYAMGPRGRKALDAFK